MGFVMLLRIAIGVALLVGIGGAIWAFLDSPFNDRLLNVIDSFFVFSMLVLSAFVMLFALSLLVSFVLIGAPPAWLL